ncbi:MAG: flagellar protein FlgN [Planctomycetes bacterium]|nr:flagellar protein FlgN [Planctomycetota bacterium]
MEKEITSSVQYNLILQNLCNVLEKEVAYYAEFTVVAAAKKDCLVNLQRMKLEKIIQDEERLAFELAEVENARVRAIKSAAVLFSMPEQEINLKDIIWRCPEPYRTKLFDLRKSLIQGIRQLTRINQLNVGLIKQSLEHVKTFLHVLVGVETEKEVYTKYGYNKSTKAIKNFVDHVA